MSKVNYLKVKGMKGIILYPSEAIEQQWETLAPGIYQVSEQGGPFRILTFENVEIKDDLIKFEGGVVKEILEKTTHFFSERTTTAYKEMGMVQKMSMVLFGPPGTGKTCSALLVMREMVTKYNALCLDFTGRNLPFIATTIDRMRAVQDNPIVVFCDEVEHNLNADVDGWATFLDGTISPNNFVFLGCTNYLNKIPKKLRERRSRIKYTIEVKSLPLQVYTEYLIGKLGKAPKRIVTQFAYLAEDAGLTIDELKHAVIDYRIDGTPIEECIETVKTYLKQDKWDDDEEGYTKDKW